LQQAKRPYAVGADAILDPGSDLALDVDLDDRPQGHELQQQDGGVIVQAQLPERAALGHTGKSLLRGLGAGVGAVRLVLRVPQPEELAKGPVGVGFAGMLGQQRLQLRRRCGGWRERWPAARRSAHRWCAGVPAPLRQRFREAHISIDVMTTRPAVRTYNVMLLEGRRVGAGLIATA